MQGVPRAFGAQLAAHGGGAPGRAPRRHVARAEAAHELRHADVGLGCEPQNFYGCTQTTNKTVFNELTNNCIYYFVFSYN